MEMRPYWLYSRLADGSLGAIDRKVLDRCYPNALNWRHYRSSKTDFYPSWTKFVRHMEEKLADCLFPEGLPNAKSLDPLRPADECLTTMTHAITHLSRRYLSNPPDRQSGSYVRLMIRDAITHFLFFSFDPAMRRHYGDVSLDQFINVVLTEHALVQMCRYRKKEAYNAFIADYTDLYCTYQQIAGQKLSTFIVEDHGQWKKAVQKAGGISHLAVIFPDLITSAHRDPKGRVTAKQIDVLLWEFKMV